MRQYDVDRIVLALVEEGQDNSEKYGFNLGKVMRFTPMQVGEIISNISIEPERKKGRWTKNNACEFCGFQPWYENDIRTLRFCPNCGADMKGEQMRLIDADALGLTDMEIIMCNGNYKEALKMLLDKIDHAPTIEPERKNVVAIPETGIGDLSDGYHTFNSLYEQRMILFAALVKAYKDKAWKSLRHEDGELCFGGGWFIVGIDTPEGSYTYHYENKYFSLFDCEELACAKHWDGHTEADAETRLMSLEPERKKGKWIHERLASTTGGTYPVTRCSECKNAMPFEWEAHYCPNCGTYMGSKERKNMLINEINRVLPDWSEEKEIILDTITNMPSIEDQGDDDCNLRRGK